ncbi:MAG: metallophosphoesterase [Saccharofermentans sp.]|nr:metallophosphoesterase [Saccharofermentans sp.]
MSPLLIVLIIVVILGLIFAVWCFTEPHILDVTNIKLRRSKAPDKTFKALGKGIDSDANSDVRIFFFSDIHAEMCFIKPERILEEIRKANEAKPLDCVIFGGDIVTEPENIAKGIRYFTVIKDGLASLGIPFYGVTGNHDLGITTDQIAECGFINLEGQVIKLKSSGGKDIYLTGADDTGRHSRRWIEPPVVPDGSIGILAIHDPDSILHINNLTDFMLAGHLHGGQMKLPFNLVFKLLRSDELPLQGVLQGVFEYGQTSMFISRGVGCGTLPVRFLTLPEASVVDIYLDNKEDT